MSEPLQALLRAQGLCGDLSPEGSWVCVLVRGHDEPHPWGAPSPLDRGYEAADFVGAERFAVEIVSGLQAELRRVRREYDQIADRGDYLIYRDEYDALVAVARAAQEKNDARRGIIASCIAVKGKLDQPYPDDERWTPWTRFIEPALRRLDEAEKDLREALARLDKSAEGGAR